MNWGYIVAWAALLPPSSLTRPRTPATIISFFLGTVWYAPSAPFLPPFPH